jgi:hypothetical protein
MTRSSSRPKEKMTNTLNRICRTPPVSCRKHVSQGLIPGEMGDKIRPGEAEDRLRRNPVYQHTSSSMEQIHAVDGNQYPEGCRCLCPDPAKPLPHRVHAPILSCIIYGRIVPCFDPQLADRVVFASTFPAASCTIHGVLLVKNRKLGYTCPGRTVPAGVSCPGTDGSAAMRRFRKEGVYGDHHRGQSGRFPVRPDRF